MFDKRVPAGIGAYDTWREGLYIYYIYVYMYI